MALLLPEAKNQYGFAGRKTPLPVRRPTRARIVIAEMTFNKDILAIQIDDCHPLGWTQTGSTALNLVLEYTFSGGSIDVSASLGEGFLPEMVSCILGASGFSATRFCGASALYPVSRMMDNRRMRH